MTDKIHELTSAQKDQAIAWINRKTNNLLRCVACGTTSWTLADHIVTPVSTEGTQYHIFRPGMVYPSVLVICNNCGNTMLFNAIHIGIVEQISGKKTVSGA